MGSTRVVAGSAGAVHAVAACGPCSNMVRVKVRVRVKVKVRVRARVRVRVRGQG